MEKINFEIFGLKLMEPMAIILNLLMSALSMFLFWKLSRLENKSDRANRLWRGFFLSFSISTFFGAFGHAFFGYFGVLGKYPCWILGALANVFAAMGMLHFEGFARRFLMSILLVVIKSSVLLVAAILTQNFVFIAIDAILTYILYTGVFAFVLFNRGFKELFWMMMGVLILLPSAFVFILKLDAHRWLNKDDISHLLMLSCIYCFYLSIKAWGNRKTEVQNG